MKDFSIDTGGKSLQLLAKDAVQLARIVELDRRFPGIQQLMWTWHDAVDRFPLVIPSEMERPFQRLGVRARDLFDRFVDPDRKWTAEQDGQDLVTALDQALNERTRMLSQMSDYLTKMRENRFAVPTRIIGWLHKRALPEDATTVSWLRDDGVIKGRTAHRIPEPEFMASLTADLSQVLTKIGLTVVRPVPDRLSYLLRPVRGQRIQLLISHGDLLAECGPILFDGEPFELTLEYVVEKSAIADKRSRDTAIGELGVLLHKHGLSNVTGEEIIEDSSALFDEWVLLEKASNRFIVVANLDKLVAESKGLVFNVGSKTVEQLHRTMTSEGARRFTRTELERTYGRRLEDRRSLGGR